MIYKTISEECSHEKILRKFFKEKCYYEGPEAFAAPLLLIGFTNRCGSNLLADYLRAAKGASGFLEQLNHDTVVNVSRTHGLNGFPDYIQHVSKGAGRYGFKASVEQVAMLYRLGITRMYPSVRVLHLTRRDTVSQAVSFSIADQTKQWTARQAKQSDARYSRSDIDRRLDWIAIQNESMRVAAKVFGFAFDRVTYEDLIDRPLEIVGQAAQFFGLTPPDTLPAPSLTRQADAVNAEFIAQYLRDVWQP